MLVVVGPDEEVGEGINIGPSKVVEPGHLERVPAVHHDASEVRKSGRLAGSVHAGAGESDSSEVVVLPRGVTAEVPMNYLARAKISRIGTRRPPARNSAR